MTETWAGWMTASMEWIEQSGWMGWVGFIVLYTLTCVFFLPGSILTVGAGAAYGFWAGTLLVAISSVAGAMVNFLTSRYLLHGWMQERFAGNEKFRALDRAVATKGWRIILLSRISPILPHSVVSYACGLTTISMGRYALASGLGFLPISAAYSYAGAVLGKVARARAGLDHGSESWIFYGLGLAVTIVVTVWSAKAASAALKEVNV